MRYKIIGKRIFHADGSVWAERGDFIEVEAKHFRRQIGKQRSLVEIVGPDDEGEPDEAPAPVKKKAAKKKAAKKAPVKKKAAKKGAR